MKPMPTKRCASAAIVSKATRIPAAPGHAKQCALDTLEDSTILRAGEQPNARNVPHLPLGYALKPGFKPPPGAAQQASPNRLGFRGKETTWEKPPGVYRLLVTG